MAQQMSPGQHGSECIHDNAQSHLPPYVDCDSAGFRNNRSNLTLKFSSDFEKAQKAMEFCSDVCAVYFPADLDVVFNSEIENELAVDICEWRFFPCFSESLKRLAISMSRLSSLQIDLSYERRTLLHHHLVWIFLMDEVCERLPLLGLHDTMERKYLENLKNITMDLPIEDLNQYKGICPDDLLQVALDVQRILAEDLMPLKRALLEESHVQKCSETLCLFFDNQYEEGKIFFKRPTTHQIMSTRGYTIGTNMVFLLFLQTPMVDLYNADDPGLVQLSILVALFHDFIGLQKDLDSLKQDCDGSVGLNLVRVSMQESGHDEKEALQTVVRRLNSYCHGLEFFMSAYTPLCKQLYQEILKFVFALYDYHLLGATESSNSRYGWHRVSDYKA
ncbi:Terpenoid synthase [Penicillium expansum]|uniref:(+)-bicyclogermacrene synthase TS4 n=1 Tax=Penicillium expansum TaxID=27334 RepID=TS4_PENEN|nr:Terpenoid synthase [Penicillium expansum]A0A0A2JP58.1 RecName: Full=(+)-bicyclogermacrene synthase TS4; AltName: Full=Sesquiterpene synthase TS4 [Penicillium expansum]KGO57192.1 Terpenoid synthase [Penicillium expansum]